MARRKVEEVVVPLTKPATSREARQAQLENLALDLIEKRLRSGEAGPQETTLFARAAMTRGRIEELRISADIELMSAKKKYMESQEELQKMFKNAVAAMEGVRYDGGEDVGPTQ